LRPGVGAVSLLETFLSLRLHAPLLEQVLAVDSLALRLSVLPDVLEGTVVGAESLEEVLVRIGFRGYHRHLLGRRRRWLRLRRLDCFLAAALCAIAHDSGDRKS